MKKKLLSFLIYLGLIIIVFLVFKNWFSFHSLSSGDWSYKFSETIREFNLYPYAWDAGFFNGLGGTTVYLLALNTYFLFTTSILFNFFHIPWIMVERLVWFWPFLIISIFSSHSLFKKLFSGKFALLSSFIYLFNTYILMLVSGGQMGVAMSYSLSPLILLTFINLVDYSNNSNKNFQFLISNLQLSLLVGLLLSLQIIFDLRIAYIALFSLFLIWLFKNIENKNLQFFLKSILFNIMIPSVLVVALNLFWILPAIISHKNPIVDLGPAYSSLGSVKFLSFAKFENTIGFLHPNWPENIFGKVGFMKPEFFLIPILAYTSLLFIKGLRGSKEVIYILYFALLGLIGGFLAKGSNEPFGAIYLWMFDHVPGFMMFRDSTKWYTLVAISYSMLIPFTIYSFYKFLKSHFQFSIFNFQFSLKSKFLNTPNMFLVIIVFCLLYLIHPALFGQLTGTFKETSVPREYTKLKEFLSFDSNFSRTLWIPTFQRFGFYSNLHSAISAQDFFKSVNNTQILKNLETNELLLQESGVKYVIVPYDSQGEIFLRDRKYDNKLYLQTINGISSIKWLKRINGFEKIGVFEISNSKDHFWSPSENLKIKYSFINPTEYGIQVQNSKKGDLLVFSEGFDKNWVLKGSGFEVTSSKFGLLNSFVLPKDGNFEFKVYYEPQKWVNIGLAVSAVTLFSILIYLAINLRRKVSLRS